jgi:branched-chain amino acid transport system substrate-binding protein
LGEQVKVGADQWAADINKAGGLLGQKVVVEAKDDGCNAEQSVMVASKVIVRCSPILSIIRWLPAVD